MFGALAESERDLIRERTQAGLSAARARGRVGGRPKALPDPKKVAMAQRLYEDPNHSVDEICRTLRISRATLYQYVGVGKRTTVSQEALPDDRQQNAR